MWTSVSPSEEAAKIGVPIAHYRTLPGIMVEFFRFVKDMGTAVGTRTYCIARRVINPPDSQFHTSFLD
jgi:hypothetical protein